MMIATGAASIIPFNPAILHSNTAHKNITIGLIPSVFLNKIGTSMLFSSCCTTTTNHSISRNQSHQYEILPTKTIGMPPKKGHIYGISSVNHAITASDSLFAISIPNKSNIRNHTYITIPIIKPNIICDLSQKDSLSYIFTILFHTICFFGDMLTIKFKNHLFSTLISIANTMTKSICVSALKNRVIIFTNIFPAFCT